MKTEMTPGVAVAAVVGGFFAIVLRLFWAAFCGSFALSTLWGWFVVPLFGLPALSMAYAYGIALVFRSAAGMRREPKSEKKLGQMIAESFFLPPVFAAVLLLAGWIAKSFI